MSTDLRGGKRPVNTVRLLIGLVVVALGLYVAWKNAQQPAVNPEPVAVEPRQPEATPETVQADPPKAKPAAEAAATASTSKKVKTQISNVTVRNQDGQVIFRGIVDVGPTLKRIERGEKLRFPNDGVVFENRERRLPRQATGYYREYVHPTSGQGGPGPQRIVKGKGGETFYTHDHYRTFQRLDPT